MLDNKYFNQLNDVYKNISKALVKEEEIGSIKTIGAVEVIFKGDKGCCVFLVYDYKSLKLIERKEEFCRETITYSPKWSAVREGTPIIEIYNSLENKPDVILIEGMGNVNENLIETSSYLGVLINKPVIAISQELKYGREEEGKIFDRERLRGYILETKQGSRPIYIMSGFKVKIEEALEIVKKMIKENKLPEPLHNAHKLGIKLKNKI